MPDITMPQLGETVTEGTIIKWYKKVGEPIAEDEILFEVSTDKVDSEVPSPASGYLAEILVPEGETVDVGARIAVVTAEPPASAGDGQGATSPASAAAATPSGEPAGPSGRAQEMPAPPAEIRGPAPEEAAPAPGGSVEEAAGEAQPAQAEAAAFRPEEQSVPISATQAPTGPTPAGPTPAGPADEQPAPSAPPGAQVGAGAKGGVSEGDGDGGVRGKVLSPVVRRLISEHGLDPAQITGTGAGGRITRADVLAYIDAQGQTLPGGGAASAPAPASVGAPPAPPAPREPAPAVAPPAPAASVGAPASPAGLVVGQQAPGPEDEVVPFTNIRRRTAEHMVRSKATSAHTLCAIEVDYEGVERVRRAVREQFKQAEGFSLTYLPFIARAAIDAIAQFPNVNASVGDDALIIHRRVDLGIAVDLDLQGLIVPVIHHASDKRLRAIAREIVDLASRARSKKLSADDIAGGTFTITNPGPFGTLITAPIINQPQVVILSTDGIKKRPVVVTLPDGTDGIAIHPTGNLALSFDHRVVDGAYAAAFLAKCKEILETRDWSQEL